MVEGRLIANNTSPSVQEFSATDSRKEPTMDSEIKRIFQISGYLIRSFSNGLEAIAKHIEAMTKPTQRENTTLQITRSSGGQSPPKPKKPTTAKSKTKGPTKTDIIMGVINSAEDGIDVETIAQETGFDKNTIRSTASRLKRQGKIKSKKQGVYTAT
jgi:hypothetical protein